MADNTLTFFLDGDMDFSDVFTGMVNCAADGSPLSYKALIQ